jgi:hypothetical protein
MKEELNAIFLNEDLKRPKFDELYKNLTNKYFKDEKYLETFFTKNLKIDMGFENIVFENIFCEHRDFYDNRAWGHITDYNSRQETVDIIKYVDFLFSSFVKAGNGTFTLDSYHPDSRMFEIMKNNYRVNSNETVLEFLEKKYSHIKFYKGELCQDKLFFSKTIRF